MPDRSQALRKAYAHRIMRLAGVVDPRIEAAFAAVPREDFAGPPPWRVSPGISGLGEGEHDVASLYEDALIAIDEQRGINNGQPSLHAQSLAALTVSEGETVVQIGAGAGYYTAILAHLVGPSGKVFAYEIEADIADRARRNLAGYGQVEVMAASGVTDSLPKTDAISVNAAASHPLRIWLDALNPGGRLLFPLHPAHSCGDMLLITRPAVRIRRLAGEAFRPRGVHRLRGRSRPRNGTPARSGVPRRRRRNACVGSALAAPRPRPSGFRVTVGR